MYQLIARNILVQSSESITDLQRIAANLNINEYEIKLNHRVVYSIK